MGVDSHRPRTTKTALTLPLNGTIYTTRRGVGAEKPLPTIGATMESELGTAYAASRIIAVNEVPEGDSKVLQIVHATIPTLENQLASNWVEAKREIGGVEFSGIERYFVYLASAYDAATPAIGSTMPYEADGTWDDSGDSYLLVDRQVVRSGVDLEPVFKVERRFYVNVGDETAQLPSNWSYSSPSIGGGRYPAVTRTFLKLASAVNAAGLSSPAVGSAMPVSSSGKADHLFNGQGYVFVGRKIVRAPDDLNPTFVLERREYIKRSTQDSLGLDPLNGKALMRRSDLYFSGEAVVDTTTCADLFDDIDHAYWGIQASGIQRSGRQLSADWYEVITEGLIGGEDGEGSGAITVDDYYTSMRYYWPPVLIELGFKNWERQDGSTETYPFVKFQPDAFRGSCHARIQRYWSKTPHSLSTINPPRPEPIVYASPGFRLNIPPCLHGAVQPICDYGTGHPVYAANAGSGETFEATKRHDGTTACTTWPASIVARDDQDKFRGGYLRTKITILKPGSSIP